VNRQQRRAAARARKASQSDKGFDDYIAQARRASPGIDDRELGKGWMRGQAFTASGAESMVIHEFGQEPRPPQDDDWLISLAYESLSFKAYISPTLLDQSIADIEAKVIPILKAKDRRASARQWLLDMLIENRGKADGNMAALMAATVGWLVKTSAIGETAFVPETPIRSIHYDITTFEVDGRRALNFRLVLGQDHTGTIPDWVKAMPPTSRPGEPAKSFTLGVQTDDDDER
jgi:hypothetical protein